jgi:hypothetical protein
MAYTDFRGLATILRNGPSFQVTTTSDVKRGDLLNKEWALADASAAGLPAVVVCLQDGASGDVVDVAKWAVIRKPTTVGAGGATTVGDHSGTLGDTLWLSTSAGAAVEVIDGDGIYQVVGQVISTQDVMLEPSFAPGDFFEDCEKETSAKTLDINDSGKAFVITGTSNVVVTLPATAVHGLWIIVNGSQDGDKLTSADPVSGDGIAGWDSGNTDNKDFSNTKTTSKAGDYIVIRGSGLAGGLMIDSGRGVWASEA